MLRSIATGFIRSIQRDELTVAQDAAKQVARERLQARAAVNVNSLLVDTPAQHRARATGLLEIIGKTLSVSVEKLRTSDVIRDLLRVPHSSLPESATATLRQKGVADPLEVGCYDLLWALDKSYTRPEWEALLKRLTPTPTSDEEMLDVIGRMTLSEYLRFFSDPSSKGS